MQNLKTGRAWNHVQFGGLIENLISRRMHDDVACMAMQF